MSDVDRGWAWVVLAASFLIHLMTYGLAWSTGVYNVIFLEAFGQPKSLTAWAGALPTAMMYAIGPIASMLTNRFGFRPVIICGGLMISCGLGLSFFAESLYYLYFTFGVLTGAGLGIVYIPAISAVSYYFDEKITIAAGIAASGVGVGNFLYPAFIRYLVNIFDWKQSFLILCAVSLHICVLGGLIRPVKRPEIRREQPILDITPFKKKSYIVMCLNVFLFCCGTSTLYVHLTALSAKMGNDADESAMLISGVGIANLISRFGYGIIADWPRMNTIILYGFSYFCTGLIILITPFMKGYVLLMTCAVMFGLLSGCFGTLLVKILIRLLGLHRFSNGYGCLLLFMAAGQLTGAFIAGAMFDLTGSYKWAFVLGGGLVMLSGLVMIYPYYYVKHSKDPDAVDTIVEKEALADNNENILHMSHRDLVQMTVSLESLAVAKRDLDLKKMTIMSTMSLNATKNRPVNKNIVKRKDHLPAHLDIERVKLGCSTETI